VNPRRRSCAQLTKEIMLHVFQSLCPVVDCLFPYLEHLLSGFVALSAELFDLLLHLRRELHLLLHNALDAEAKIPPALGWW